MARLKKKERHEILLRQVREKPFLTDEELAGLFEVSIPAAWTGWNWAYLRCVSAYVRWLRRLRTT